MKAPRIDVPIVAPVLIVKPVIYDNFLESVLNLFENI